MHDHGCTDPHSLVHSTGEFKRITVQHTVTVIQTYLLHDLSGTFPDFFFADFLMFGYCLMYLCSNCPNGTQCSFTVLEDHSDLCSQKLTEFFFAHVCKVLTFVPDITSCNQTFLSQEPHDCLDNRAFAASGLAHDSKDFALL